MSKPLICLERPGRDFVVTLDEGLEEFKREHPVMVRAITLALLDFAITLARWEKDRNPLMYGGVYTNDNATAVIQGGAATAKPPSTGGPA